MILNIKKSFLFTAIVLGAHTGALLLNIFLPIALWQKIGLAALIGTSLWWQVRYGVWASACEIKLEEDGACTRTIKGAQSRYRVTQATIHAGFIRLRLMRPGEPRRMQLVPRDAVEPEVYRNLLTQIVQRRLPAPDNKTSA